MKTRSYFEQHRIPHPYRDMMLKDLRQLARQKRHTPTPKEAREAAKRHELRNMAEYKTEFGSFRRALEAAGVTTYQPSLSREEVIRAVQKVGELVDRPPTYLVIVEMCRGMGVIISRYDLVKHIGSMEDVRSVAGFTEERWRTIIIADLQSLAAEFGRTPRAYEVQAAGEVGEITSPSKIKKYFRTIPLALEAAGLEPDPRGRRIHTVQECND